MCAQLDPSSVQVVYLEAREMLFLLWLLAHAATAQLPPEMKACSLSSSDYKRCLEQEVLNAISFLKNGNKQFQLISLDPLSFSNLHINQGQGPVAIDLLFKDVSLHGLSRIKVVSLTNDWKELKGRVFFKKVHLKAQYKINGKVLILPIQGSGPSDIEFDDLDVNFAIKFREVKKNKIMVFEVVNFFVDLTPKKIHFNFQNLFNGNKALGDNMNEFLNVNWEEVMKEIKPALAKGLSEVFTKVANLVFSKIPVGQLKIP